MPIGHDHAVGWFDADHCRACTREAGLLHRYHRVQREEGRLRQATEWAWTARRWAGCAFLVSAVGVLLAVVALLAATSRLPGGEGPTERPERYEIRVRGVLDSRWSAWFEGLEVSSDEAGHTRIAGPVADQAALHGLLAKVRDLGLPLLSVRRIDPQQ